jgi:hypothetical protein
LEDEDMSAFHALDAARAAGIEVEVDGKDLVLSGASAPPTDILDMLRRHKSSIVGLLQLTSAPILAFTDMIGSASGTTSVGASGDITGYSDITGSSPIITSSDITGPADFTVSFPIFASTEFTDYSDITGYSDIAAFGNTTGATDIGASGDTTGTTPVGDITCSAGITALRHPPAGDWSIEDWQAYFDERAAIAEFDGGLPRPKAEKRAFDYCVAEWLYRNAVNSPLRPCPVCGEADRPNDNLLPVGLGGGEVWLHCGCAPLWRAGRIAEAITALAAMGIGSQAKEGAP